MRSFWSDPYLWVHLTGVAAVPVLLELCLLGLAAGDPFLPVWLEGLVVGAIGTLPILWMQWQRPFSIFSLLALALKPSQLTEEQRRILRRFKAPMGKVLAVGTAAVLLVILWELFQISPLAMKAATVVSGGRLGGLLLATIAFLGCNLFLQVPVSVLQVLLTREAAFATTEPYPVELIPADFSLLGLHVDRILPPLQRELKRKDTTPVAPAVTPPVATEASAVTEASAAIAEFAAEITAPLGSDAPVIEVEVGSEFGSEFEEAELEEESIPTTPAIADVETEITTEVATELEAELVETDPLTAETEEIEQYTPDVVSASYAIETDPVVEPAVSEVPGISAAELVEDNPFDADLLPETIDEIVELGEAELVETESSIADADSNPPVQAELVETESRPVSEDVEAIDLIPGVQEPSEIVEVTFEETED